MTDTLVLNEMEGSANLDWASCLLHQDPTRGRVPLDHENRVKAMALTDDLSNDDNWLNDKGIHHRDLRGIRGNGPFGSHGSFMGIALHVNVAHAPGTSPDFFASGTSVNPSSVCPNFQVMTTGEIWQLLPIDWQPWCQEDGNYRYAAIETGGMPGRPFTQAQLYSISRIVRAYTHRMHMPLRVTNHVDGDGGLGTHAMGGIPWGGHPCPGKIREHERHEIVKMTELYMKKHHISR